MKQQDLILAANSYAINNGDNAFDRKILRAAFKAGAAWVSEEPELLDPHTCDLMVGDVVFVYGIGKDQRPDKNIKLKAVVMSLHEWPNLSYKVAFLDMLEFEFCTREWITLTHRNGATIKEVGNE